MFMKNTFVLIFLAFSTVTFGQWGNTINLSSNITKETRDVTDFTKISATDDFVVYIKLSNTEDKVEIEANENLHEYIVVEKEGDVLKLSTKSYSTNSKKGADEKLVAHVTAKRLTAISGDGDAEIKIINKISANSFSIYLDDDAVLKGAIAVKSLDVDMDDDAELEIEGSADTVDIDADSDSMIDGYRFVVNDLDIKLDGDSEARLTVNGKINITTRGDSEFTYKGNGTIEHKKVSGDSGINHYNR